MATTAEHNHTIISPVNTEKRQEINVQTGDTVRVVVKIPEGDGEHRLQPFEGIVLARKHGSEPGATFTVRKVVAGVGVEKIFPLYSPRIDEIKIIRRAKTRKSKLYHIRDKAARQIRRQMRKMVNVDITTKTDDDEAEDESPEASDEDEAAAPDAKQTVDETQDDTSEANEGESAEENAADNDGEDDGEKDA